MEQKLKLENDIEAILNDFEAGFNSKDEAIIELCEYVVERAETAVKIVSNRFEQQVKPTLAEDERQRLIRLLEAKIDDIEIIIRVKEKEPLDENAHQAFLDAMLLSDYTNDLKILKSILSKCSL